jgi:hypothetical protein
MNCAPGCSSSGSDDDDDDDAASGATDDVELSSGSIDAAAPIVPAADDDEAATTVARLDDDDDELVDAPTPDSDDEAPSEAVAVVGLDPVFTCFAIIFHLIHSLIQSSYYWSLD